MGDQSFLYIGELKETHSLFVDRVTELAEISESAPYYEDDSVSTLFVRINLFLSRLNYTIMFELKEGKKVDEIFSEIRESLYGELQEVLKMQQLIIVDSNTQDSDILVNIKNMVLGLMDLLKK